MSKSIILSTARLFTCLLLIPAIISSCGGCRKKQKTPTPLPAENNINVPDFCHDSAFAFIQKQLSFGPRIPDSEAHKLCADYLYNKLKTFTPDVIIQKARVKAFNGNYLNIKNIIASFKKDSGNRILLCAHWDSRPWADKDDNPENHNKPVPGANDGASGVGVLLEIARQLSLNPPYAAIDIVLFDAEDYGSYNDETEESWGLGSQYWSKNPHKPDYNARFGILLDMVGATNATFTMEANSMYFAPDIMRKIWDMAASSGYSDFFISKETGPVTDDHLYINKYLKIPTIDIIHYDNSNPNGFFPFWHTSKDDINIIDKKTLKAVGQTLLEIIYRE